MRTLARKFHVALSITVVCSATVAGTLVLRRGTEALDRCQEHFGSALAKTIAGFCVETLLVEDYPYIESYVQRSAENVEDLVAVRVLGRRDGDAPRVVASFAVPLDASRERTPTRVFRSPIVARAEGEEPETIGEVEVELSPSRLTGFTSQLPRDLFLVAIAGIALVLLVSHSFLRRTVLGPLSELSSHASRIALGRLDRPIELERDDELGLLAATMETLRANLLSTRERLIEARGTDVAGATTGDGAVLALENAATRTTAPASPTGTVRTRPAIGVELGPRVLLADDNPINREVTGRMLERLGCRVDLATNGAEAVAAARSARYDVVFMDCRMPDVDGYEATARIRALEGEAARVPIVALTAFAMAGDREACLDAGMDDYISKPIRKQTLSETLERALARTCERAATVDPAG